jgi:uncharacterized protein (TIGR00369 family)
VALAVREAEVRRFLAEHAFLAAYGFQLRALQDGECTLEVPWSARWQRPGGVLSGPVFMAAADAAMWFAVLTRVGTEAMWVTADLKTAFLRAAREETVRCTARVLKQSASSAYGVAECVGEDGGLLTHHTVTYLRAR